MGIAAVESGWHLSQATYCKDALAKWGMEECRAIGSLEDVGEEVREEDEPEPNDVHKAQRLAGGFTGSQPARGPTSASSSPSSHRLRLVRRFVRWHLESAVCATLQEPASTGFS